MAACANCGAIPIAGARFCDSCGAPIAARPAPARIAPAVARTQPSVLPRVTAGGLGGIGALMLLGIFVPFAGQDGFNFALKDDNGELVVLIAIAALLCVGACVSEFLGLREGLLIGTGVAAGFTLFAAAVLVALPTRTDLSPEIGYVIWVLATFLGIALVVLLIVGVVGSSNAEPVLTPFWACVLGGGLLLTLGVLLPERDVSFSEHIVTETPGLALLNVLYALVPTLMGIAAVASPRRSTLMVAVGVVAWYGTSWMVQSTSSNSALSTFREDPSLPYYVQMIAVLTLGLAAIGGGLVHWQNGSPRARNTTELVVPIVACSALVLMVLYGFVAGF